MSAIQFIKNIKPVSWLVIAFFILSSMLFFSPSIQRDLRELFAPAERRVLSIAMGTVIPGVTNRVIKILTPKSIILEIYSAKPGDEMTLAATVTINDKRDAQFQFQGRATNLALKDMDSDGVFEIIAPSYDASLVPHINIFRYNTSNGRFEPYIE